MSQEKKNVSNFSELLNKEIRANCKDQLYKGQSPVRNAPNLDVANNRWLYHRDLTLWTDSHTCYGFGYFVKDGQLMADSLYGPQPVVEDGVILPGSPGAFLACQDFSRVNLLDRPETPRLPEGYQGFQVAEDSPLREAQREAVRKADAPLSFIWGPPGTGKTFTIVNTVKAILSASSNKVLVTSTADKAVEAVVDGLSGLQLGSKLQFCKDEGEAQICKEDIRLHDYWRQQAKAKLPAEKGQSAADLSLKADRYLSQAKVTATNSLSAVAKLTYGKVERITHLIIDEASMMPMWMVSLLAGLLKSRNPELRIILVGDPKQLPAVVISKELEGHPMGMNVYNYMGINDPQYCTPENIVTLLDSTSRMPDLLTRAISRAWYSDALVALRKGEYSPLFAGRPQVDFWSDNYPLFWPFSSRINMLGEEDRPERCNYNYNVAEAAHATSLVLACKANNRTCLVIAPYNNQVNLINHWLDKNGVSDVRAVSVHKAQGQEADIVIWSVCFDPNKKMCRHNSPQSAVAQTLANVALSRAKQQVIILGAYPGQPTVAGQFLSLIAPLIQEQAKVEVLPQQDESPPARFNPAHCIYQDDWLIDSDQIEQIWQKLRFSSGVSQKSNGRWTEPRLTTWFSEQNVPYTYSGIEQPSFGWPDWVEQLAQTLASNQYHKPNSLLVNVYRNGLDKCSMHKDDEPLFDPTQPIFSVSLGATRALTISKDRTSIEFTQNLVSGSLFTMLPGFQEKYFHGVPQDPNVKEPRINLTFRYVKPQEKPEYNGPTTVVNLNNNEDYDVYIGRAGQGLDGYFGNPIVRGKQCCVCGEKHFDNKSIVACYRKRFYRMIEEDEAFAERISHLKGKRLGCFCKPDYCHGDVIAEYLESPEDVGSDLSFEPAPTKPVKKTNPWGASEELIQALLSELK